MKLKDIGTQQTAYNEFYKSSIKKVNRQWHGPLAKIILFRGTHLGNTWFMVYLKDI